MAEPLRSYSSDVPEFDTYPASPEDAIGRHRLMDDSNQGMADERLDLDSAAREIGETLGRVAVKVIDAKDQIVDRMDAATYRLRRQVTETTERYVDVAKEKMEEARYRTRNFATTATQDYPVHVILGAAALGLLIGAGLRVWRENRG